MQSPIRNKAFSVSYLGIFTAVLAVLSFFESRFSVNFGVPGVKAGLSNIVILLSIMVYSWKVGFFLSIAKIVFSVIFSSGPAGFMFTAFGTLASYFAMLISKKLLREKVSAVGISVLGGSAHITAQYMCSALILKTWSVWGMYPSSAVLSVVTSAVVGLICNLILERKYKK